MKRLKMQDAMAKVLAAGRPLPEAALSLDHLSELTHLLIDNPKLLRELGFVKPKRANTWGDLVRWGFVNEKPLGSENPRTLTEDGRALLKRVAGALKTGGSQHRAKCPGCGQTWLVHGKAWCPCRPKAPFVLVPESIEKLVAETFGKGRKRP